jgi:hypothetical protein
MNEMNEYENDQVNAPNEQDPVIRQVLRNNAADDIAFQETAHMLGMRSGLLLAFPFLMRAFVYPKGE